MDTVILLCLLLGCREPFSTPQLWSAGDTTGTKWLPSSCTCIIGNPQDDVFRVGALLCWQSHQACINSPFILENGGNLSKAGEPLPFLSVFTSAHHALGARARGGGTHRLPYSSPHAFCSLGPRLPAGPVLGPKKPAPALALQEYRLDREAYRDAAAGRAGVLHERAGVEELGLFVRESLPILFQNWALKKDRTESGGEGREGIPG